MPDNRRYYLLFFLSGATSLAYEVVFYKLLGYVFGNTIWATTTVLASFMGGLAIGSWLLGRVADRVSRPVALYAVLELLIGGYALAVPWILSAGQGLYVSLCSGQGVMSGFHVALRFSISVAVLIFPTVMMGGTLPLLARAVVQRPDRALSGLSGLYAANTLGAAVGTLCASYLLIRWLGIYGALGAGAALNVVIFVRARRLSRDVGEGRGCASVVHKDASDLRGLTLLAVLAAAFATGANAFVLEVVWTHLLAVIVGTSVYAFGMMLFTFLLAIAAGSFLSARYRWPTPSSTGRVGILQLALGATVLLSLPAWDLAPHLFTAAGLLSPGFWLMEGFRLLTCMLILFPSCLCLGATFPLLLHLGAGQSGRVGARVGLVSALNTVGCIVGALVTGFWLVDRLGSRWTLMLAAMLAFFTGAAFLLRQYGLKNRRVLAALGAAATLSAACALLLPGWNLSSLISGANVYFDKGVNLREIVYIGEDTQSGVVTVSKEPDLTLRTNGKFEGNDNREMTTQHGFALVPVLFTPDFGNALNIGLGTGVTAGALSRFPFENIDVVEFSPRIVEAAGYFSHVNFDVLSDPRVNLILNDGRNHLLVTDRTYDLVTIEVTSIWFAGAGNLYNREFYQLVNSRLSRSGVLQQWLQLHHMRRLDLLVVLNTVRSVFPHVSLWVRGDQGIIIATPEPQEIDYRHVEFLNRLDEASPLRNSLEVPDFFHLTGSMALDETGVASALNSLNDRPFGALLKQHLVSTDMYPWLEYFTPMGNALPDAQQANLAFLQQHDRRAMPTLTHVPNQAARTRVKTLFAHAKARCGRALRLLDKLDVEGDKALIMVRQSCLLDMADFDW